MIFITGRLRSLLGWFLGGAFSGMPGFGKDGIYEKGMTDERFLITKGTCLVSSSSCFYEREGI